MQAIIDNPILTFTHKTNRFQRIRMGLGMISFSSQKSDTKATKTSSVFFYYHPGQLRRAIAQ